MYAQFARIQEKAGIHRPCHKEHEHTRSYHVYGFHDLRRAFATMNADKLTGDALHSDCRKSLRFKHPRQDSNLQPTD